MGVKFMAKNRFIIILIIFLITSLPIAGAYFLLNLFNSAEVNIGNIIVWGSIFSGLFSIIACIITAILLIKIFKKEIKYINSLIYNISQGDLTKNVEMENCIFLDSLHNNLSNLIFKFRGLISQITTMTDKTINYTNDLSNDTTNINESSRETSKVINELAVGMEEQANAVSKTGEHIADILNMANNIAENSESIETGASRTVETVNNSYKNFESLIEKMKQSADSNINILSKIKKLEEKTTRIEGIANQVDKISESTNLLALNASIEAAHAGDAGKGFAVVAEEVRKLAENSSEQSKQIQNIINQIIREISEISSSMENEVKVINEHISFSQITREYLNKINIETNDNFNSLKDINSRIENQVNRLDDMGVLIEKMSSISQTIAASTQEVAANAEDQSATTENTFYKLNNLSEMNKEISKYISSFVKNYKIDEQTRKYINNGMNILKTLANEKKLLTMDYNICTRILRENKKEYPYFELFALFQKDGLRKAITLDYDKNEVFQKFAHRPYYKAAIKGKEYISEPYISVDTNNYCIAMAVPVRNEKGEISGIMMGDLKL